MPPFLHFACDCAVTDHLYLLAIWQALDLLREGRDQIQSLALHVFLSVLAKQSLWGSCLGEEGNLLGVENQRKFVCWAALLTRVRNELQR